MTYGWYVRNSDLKFLALAAISSHICSTGWVSDLRDAERFDSLGHAQDFARWLGLTGVAFIDFVTLTPKPDANPLEVPSAAEIRQRALAEDAERAKVRAQKGMRIEKAKA